MSVPAPTWRDLREARVVVPEHVAFRDMVKETVVLDIRNGRYHSLNRVGARFFEVMRTGEPLSKVAARVADDYRQPIDRVEQDLARFCARLADLDLIELHQP
jgi:Coenzyme PQQ synthesis protein D (PqqD)